VAISTVSAVLNHPETTTKASPATRARICEIARKKKYMPNAFGRSLRTGRSHVVGILGQLGLFDSNTGNTLYGASTVLHEAGYNIELTQTGQIWTLSSRIHPAPSTETREEQCKKLADAAEKLLHRGVDGILLAEIVNDGNRDFFLKLSRRIPLIKVFAPSGTPEIPSVHTNEAQIGRLAAGCLWDAGHRDVAILGRRPVTVETIKEFWQYHGCLDRVRHYPDGTFFFEDGRAVLHHILQEEPQITGIFAYNDTHAAGMLYEAQKCGIRIPERFSIIGVNNLEISEQLYPRLTTIALPAVQQGEKAAELLLDLISGKTVHDCILEPSLICRESVRALGADQTKKEKK